MRVYRKDLIRRTWNNLQYQDLEGYHQDIVKNVIDTFLYELSSSIIRGEAVTLTRVASFYPHQLKDTYLYDFQQKQVVPKRNRWVVKCEVADNVMNAFKARKRG